MSGRVEIIGNATLYLGSCDDILPALAADSSEIAFTSPPYNLGEGMEDKGGLRVGNAGSAVSALPGAHPSRVRIVPCTRDDARAFIAQYHRHHGVPVGWLWLHGARRTNGTLCGVAVVGRPVARALNDGLTVEVTRVCTLTTFTVVGSDGRLHSAPTNAMLYRASERTAKAMGYVRGLTYLLETEWDRFDEKGNRVGGAGVRAAGWRELWRVKGRSWDCESRPRTDKHPTVNKVAIGWGDFSHVAAYRAHLRTSERSEAA